MTGDYSCRMLCFGYFLIFVESYDVHAAYLTCFIETQRCIDASPQHRVLSLFPHGLTDRWLEPANVSRNGMHCKGLKFVVGNFVTEELA
jgi:hypothetical protein